MSARTRQTNNNAEALDDFISAKFEIDAMLERLKGFSEDHFGITRTRFIGSMSEP